MDSVNPTYSDFGYLTSLRGEVQAQGQDTNQETIKEVAQQFEAIFVQMMLKSMRDASKPTESGLFASDQMDMYQDMFDQQIALDLSKEGGMGLTDILVRQLGGSTAPSPAQPDLASALQLAQPQASQAYEPIPTAPITTATISPGATSIEAIARTAISRITATNETADIEPVLPPSRPDISSPSDFVDQLWTGASKVAEQLGVAPEALIAQAALETGWGKFIMKNPDGSSSNNIFGIKANNDWQGPRTVTQTMEFKEGQLVRETHAFRSYSSMQEAFEDYQGFLKSKPRYDEALAAGMDSEGFAQGLADGGYATDPKYAEKIIGILNREEYQVLVAEQASRQIDTRQALAMDAGSGQG